MDVRMAAALAGAVPNVAVFCREQQISRQTFYKWRARFRAEGIVGLQERSRRPVAPAGLTPVAVEDAVVLLRKQLADAGADNGPDSIRWALLAAGQSAPSRATISRVLTRRGLVSPQPHKRPRASLHRFVYARPNECWQSDWSQWQLADGTQVAIAATIDDHSRLLVGIGAMLGEATLELTWSVMAAAIAAHGIPARSLTDNGWVYSGHRRGISVAFELNLRALGCQPICSTPRHPQTCGKIERHWQTLKRWLTAHGPHERIEDLTQSLTDTRSTTTTNAPTGPCTAPPQPRPTPPTRKPARPPGRYQHRSPSTRQRSAPRAASAPAATSSR